MLDFDSLTVEQAVANGVKFLNELFGDEWRGRIDPETLDLTNPYKCVCGQLWSDESEDHDGYDFARRTLFTEANSWIEAAIPKTWKQINIRHDYELEYLKNMRSECVATFLGFSVANGAMYDWDDLQEAWLEELGA